MMGLFNEINKLDDRSPQSKAVVHEAFSALIRLLSPFTPHIAHEMWLKLGFQSAMIDEAWPEADEEALEQDEIEMVVQVNGKRRSSINVPAAASKEDCEAAARSDEQVQRHTEGLTVRKVIVVPNKLVNIVAN